jgi:MFS family permease
MFGYFRLLRDNPDYARLWLAQSISLIGDWFSTVALLSLVSAYTDNSGLAVSLLLLARFLPPLLVGPYAGVLVDRLNRKHLLIFSDSLRAIIVLSLLLANQPDRLWLIYVLTVLQFALTSLFEPGQSAILPSLVPAEDLVRANVFGSVTWSIMLAIGAAVGGVVATVLGTPAALVIDAATFAVSALLIASIRTTITGYGEKKEGMERSQLGFVDGLRYVVRHPATAAVLLVKLGGNIGNVDTLMTAYATRLFVVGNDGTGSLGLFYAAFGVGAILGPLVLNRLNDGSVSRMRRLIVVSYVWIAIGWFVMGGAPTLILATLALIIKAMGSSIYWTYSSAILQKVTPDQFLGRLFSLDLAGYRLATVISTLITGWLVDQISVDNTLGVRNIVFGTGVFSLIPLVLWTMALPWIERQDAATPQTASD